MTTPAEIEKKFWKAIKSDRTVMLGLVGATDGHTRPMTAQLDGDEGPLWFFGSTDSSLAQNLSHNSQGAVLTFAGKDHDVFASVRGNLSVETDASMIDRLWNPFVAAWYSGKDDPKLVLLRLDPSQGQIWLDGSSLIAGIKMMFGIEVKNDYKDKVAKVDLS